MNLTTRSNNNTSLNGALYMALELSQSKWLIAFGNGVKTREVTIKANDIEQLLLEIQKAKQKFRLLPEALIFSCYEAGRDGFWIHRCLEKLSIKNNVVDSSSIQVNRRARHVKTDRLDAQKLLRQLILHLRGEEKLALVRVPSEEEEDRRRLHRERERLKKEKTGHTNRIKSLLNLHGIKFKGKMSLATSIRTALDWKGEPLGKHQQEELMREVERLKIVEIQLNELEKKQGVELRENPDPAYEKMRTLKSLKGVGGVSAWILVMEWLGWRTFNNRREVGAAAGLVGTPYSSGESQREQGITKSGNSRIRALMIELSWCWLRHQPQSDLSQWFEKKFGRGKRSRKVGIVALARRLLIALWRYVTTGELPAGAELKPECAG
jgi:transposase